MSKTVKVEDQVYTRLDEFRGKHETFSSAVSRLLDIRDGVIILTSRVDGMREYAEYRAKKLQEAAAADAPGDRAKMPDVPPG